MYCWPNLARALGLVALLAVLLSTAAAASRKASKSGAVYTVTATTYEAVASQTDSKPFVTADNSRIPRGYGSHTRWLALSRDLLRPWGGPFEFGDKVHVTGISPALDGVYTVHDTMNRRYRHRLDVLAHPREHLSLARTGVRLRRLAGPARRQPPKSVSQASPRPATPGRQARHEHRAIQTLRRQPPKALAKQPARLSHKAVAPGKPHPPARATALAATKARRKAPRTSRQAATRPKPPKKRLVA